MHMMIDLETMGTQPGAAIVAIGACLFNEERVFSNRFYQTITLESAVRSGATLDPSTIIWWLQQGRAARQEITDANGMLEEALTKFETWLANDWALKDSPLDGVWGNGASFDNVLMAETYRRLNRPLPWKFWQDRCYRTMKAQSDVAMVREGTHHNALDDAVSQAKHLIEIWKG